MSDGSNQGVSSPEQPRVSLFGRRPKLRSPAESLQPQAAPPPPPPPGRKKRGEGLSRLSGLLSFILIAAVLVLAGFGFAMIEARKPGPLTADKVVVITREDDGGAIPDQLARAGVIDSPLWFNLTLLLDGNRGKIRRGEFLFKEHLSLRGVEDVLVSGKLLLHKVTVPEGLTSEQVVQRLRDNDVFVGEVKEIPREGSILPETYEFERGVARAKVLSVMEAAQAKALDEIWKKRAPDLPIKSPGELVTLASIVEKETGKTDERPHVAGVFINRLQKRMKLESDPTIVYGLVGGKGTLGHPITKTELLQPMTPNYNTYLIEGLPPGPICNPGKAAMEAVANPLHTQDLFFVADGTGGHAFADTLDQHQKNVVRWRQIEKDAKDKLAPDATPTPPAPPAKRGALDSIDPKTFGSLAAPAAAGTKPPTAAGDLVKRLARVGGERQTREALLGPSGTLSAGANVRGLADIGAVVQGVNDQPAPDEPNADNGPPTTGPIQSYPLSPAALAEQQTRAARYGAQDIVPPDNGVRMMANADAAPPARPGARPRAFDASEGTPLDPLRNTTYDLNYPKVVPVLK